MKNICSKLGLFLLFAVAAIASMSSTTLAAGQPRCFDDWSVGAAIIKDRGLVSVEDLTRRAKTKLAGKIVKTRLCSTNAGYAYMVVVRTPKGRLKTVKIDARNPFSDPGNGK